jgi:hypothetical protein
MQARKPCTAIVAGPLLCANASEVYAGCVSTRECHVPLTCVSEQLIAVRGAGYSLAYGDVILLTVVRATP